MTFHINEVNKIVQFSRNMFLLDNLYQVQVIGIEAKNKTNLKSSFDAVFSCKHACLVSTLPKRRV